MYRTIKRPYLLVFLICILILPSCLTTEKAEDYLRGHNKLANVCHTEYPCVPGDSTITFDSTGFKRQIDSLNELTKAYQELLDHIEPTIITDTAVDSIKIQEQGKKIIGLEQIIIIKDKQIANLNYTIQHIQPIIKHETNTIIDSAGNQAYRDQIIILQGTATKLNTSIALLNAKVSNKNKELWIERIILFLLLVYGIAKIAMKFTPAGAATASSGSILSWITSFFKSKA